MTTWINRAFGAAVCGLMGFGCGPTATTEQEPSGATSSGGTGDSDGAMLGRPCQQRSDAALGLIREVNGELRLEFGRFDSSGVELECDAAPPCEGGDGEHTVAVLQGASGPLPALGEYSAEAGTLWQTERSCGCCNGEGGEPNDWDDTTTVDAARLVIDGADTSCVSGEYLDGSPARGVGPLFLARWCR